jgi:hypothetical protein
MKKAIFIFLFLIAGPAYASETDLIFSEIMYDLPGGDNNHEWVEVFNVSTSSIEVLTGSGGDTWRFNDGSNHTLNLFQGTTTIQTQEYFVLADDAEQFLVDYPDYSGIIFDTVMSLSNSSSTLSLSFDGGDNYPVSTNYDSSFGADGNGFTLEWENIWRESYVQGGTPGQANSLPQEDPPEDDPPEDPIEEDPPPPPPVNFWDFIIINEFLPNPAGRDDNEWIEIYNSGNNPVDLVGFKLQDNSARIFTLDEHVLSGGQYLVLDKNTTGISLNNTGGDSVNLYNPDGELLESVIYQDTAQEDKSFARLGDAWQWTIEPTPGQGNIFVANQPPVAKISIESTDNKAGQEIILSAELSEDPEEGNLEYLWDFGDDTTGDEEIENHVYEAAGSYLVKLIVTDLEDLSHEVTLVLEIEEEILDIKLDNIQPIDFELYDLIISEFIPNPEGSDDHEWIELYNNSNQDINLLGWQVDDQDGGSKPYIIQEELIILANSFLLIPREQSKITLNNSEDSVRLLTPLGEVWQEIEYQGIKEGQSQAWDFLNQEWFVSDTQTPAETNIFIEVQAIIYNISDLENFSKNDQVIIHGIALHDVDKTKRSLYLVEKIGEDFYYDNILEVYSHQKTWPEIKQGDYLEVVGKISKTGGLPRVKIKNQDNIFVNNLELKLIEPEITEAQDVEEDFLGNLLKVKGMVVKKSGKSVYLASDIDEDWQVRVYSKDSLKDLNIKKGSEIIASGILSETDSGFKLSPLAISDIWVSQEVLGTKEEGSNIEHQSDTDISTSSNKIFGQDRQSNIKKILVSILAGVFVLVLVYFLKKKKKPILN